MAAKKFIFATNQHKAASKVAINSIMIGSLFFILTLIWALDPDRFSPIIVSQIVLSIPLLFVSTLAYTKIGYSEKEEEVWDALGWFTSNIGNIFVLNAVGLIVGGLYPQLAESYFALTIALMGLYTLGNVLERPEGYRGKIFKYAFFVLVLAGGGLYPLLSGM